MSGDVEATIAILRDAALALQSVTTSTVDEVRALAAARNGIDAAMSAHNHHVIWNSRGGPTDLDNLIGLCRKCHSLVHAGLLDHDAAA